MKLIKFRIQKYKSIKDSEWCWLASDLTTLAGKNESGKSAILEALRDFDTNVIEIPGGAYPLDESGESVIELCFEVNKATIDEIAKEINITVDKTAHDLIAKNGLTILKYADGSYDLEQKISEALDRRRDEINQQHIKKIQSIIEKLKKVEQLSSIAEPKLDGTIEEIQQSTAQFVAQVNPQLSAIPEEAKRQEVSESLTTIKTEWESFQKKSTVNRFLDEVTAYIPNFIFFSDFLDILPFELPLAEAKNHKTVQNFAKVAGLDLDKVIKTTDVQRRKIILNKHSATITGDFMDYWGQNEIELVADSNGENLVLGIKEAGKTMIFKVEQRSKGFQWFLSFYLRLNAEKDETNIILIDEPGLYLHAKAQKDVLKVLEEISTETQIIFSTHSPYLIDANRLDRVRLILKDNNGTRIENKIHKGADSETLTPIITAIGLDLTRSLSIAAKQNILLEGISDYYFLQALKEYVPRSKAHQANIIPCVGASKVPQMASFLIGLDLEFLAILDNDSEGKRVAKELSKKLSLDDTKIISVSNKDDYSIEDLFSHADFNSFVLNEVKNGDPTVSNSKFLKDEKLDKVLLSKKFLEQVKKDRKKINLSKETVNTFKGLFEKISSGF